MSLINIYNDGTLSIHSSSCECVNILNKETEFYNLILQYVSFETILYHSKYPSIEDISRNWNLD